MQTSGNFYAVMGILFLLTSSKHISQSTKNKKRTEIRFKGFILIETTSYSSLQRKSLRMQIKWQILNITIISYLTETLKRLYCKLFRTLYGNVWGIVDKILHYRNLQCHL